MGYEANTLDTAEATASQETPEATGTDETGTGTEAPAGQDTQTVSDVGNATQTEAGANAAAENQKIFGKYNSLQEAEQAFKGLERQIGMPEQVEYRRFRENQADFERFQAYQRQQAQAQSQQREPVRGWNPPVQFNERVYAGLVAAETSPEAFDKMPADVKQDVQKYAQYLNQMETMRLHKPNEYFDAVYAPRVQETMQSMLAEVIERAKQYQFTEENRETVSSPEFVQLVQSGVPPMFAKEMIELRKRVSAPAAVAGASQKQEQRKLAANSSGRKSVAGSGSGKPGQTVLDVAREVAAERGETL